MRSLSLSLLAACLLQSVAGSSAGAQTSSWTPGGTLVFGGPQPAYVPSVLADGSGGAFILWADFRNPNEPVSSPKADVYGIRLTPAGAIAPGWPAAGLGIATQLGNDIHYGAVLDGSGGLYVLWGNDRGGGGDIQLQRLTGTGEVAPGWPDTGLVLSASPGQQGRARLVADGTGGVHVAWFESLEPPAQGTAYRTHVLADGALAPGWPVNGRRHQPAVASTYVPALLPLPDGGFYAAWAEFSEGGFYEASRLVGARYDASGHVAPAGQRRAWSCARCCFETGSNSSSRAMAPAAASWCGVMSGMHSTTSTLTRSTCCPPRRLTRAGRPPARC